MIGYSRKPQQSFTNNLWHIIIPYNCWFPWSKTKLLVSMARPHNCTSIIHKVVLTSKVKGIIIIHNNYDLLTTPDCNNFLHISKASFTPYDLTAASSPLIGIKASKIYWGTSSFESLVNCFKELKPYSNL